MNIAHLLRTIQDEQDGELLLGAQVMLCSPGTQTPISNSFYSDAAMTQQLPNPYVSDDGIIDIYAPNPITVLVKITYGDSVSLADYVPILPLAETIFTSPTAITIINSPGTHLFLAGIDAQNAQWVDLDEIYLPTDDALLGWFMASTFVLANVVRDANGAVSAADVTWPDNNNGHYTADLMSTGFPGRVDAWHVTWTEGQGRTYFQSAITRDVNGAPTNTPTPVVINGITNTMS